MSPWCSGSTADSHSAGAGSIPVGGSTGFRIPVHIILFVMAVGKTTDGLERLLAAWKDTLTQRKDGRRGGAGTTCSADTTERRRVRGVLDPPGAHICGEPEAEAVDEGCHGATAWVGQHHPSAPYGRRVRCRCLGFLSGEPAEAMRPVPKIK